MIKPGLFMRWGLALLILLPGIGLGAQNNHQFWGDYNFRYFPAPHLRLSSEFGFRTQVPDDQYRGLGGIATRWTPKKIHETKLPNRIFDFTLGLRYFFTYNPDENSLHEIRLFQDFRISWPTGPRFRLVHRVRLEERFEEELDSRAYDFSGRLRYRIGTNILLRGPFLSNFYIPAYAEAFFNLDRGIQFNDVIRLHSGIGIYISDNFGLETTVGLHRLGQSSYVDDRASDLVYRLRLFHDLN